MVPRKPRLIKKSERKFLKKKPKREQPRPAGRLTKYEQETIVNYNKEEKFATLFTYQKSLINHMMKQGAEIMLENKYGGVIFKFPKTWVRKPLVPRKER